QPPLPGVPQAVSAKVDFLAHYKPVAAPAATASTAGADEEIAKLKALGYVGAGEATSRPASAGKSTHTAGWYNNEALILKDQGKLEDAIHAYDKAIELDPKLSSALWNLSDLLFAQKRDVDRSDDLLVRAHANGLPEGGKFLIGRAIGYQRAGQIDRSLRLLEKAVTAKPDDAELHMFRGRYRIDAQDCAGALADFIAAQNIQPENPVGYASAGIAQICLGRHDDARRSFARSLQLDPNQPKLRQYLQGPR
ncbi:MAG TPA: tetratricopeptide repeat protein, partial [Thermoanaerobaculia bacterium]